MEAALGVGNVPAWRGLAYIVYPRRELRDDQARRQPNFRFEIGNSAATVETPNGYLMGNGIGGRITIYATYATPASDVPQRIYSYVGPNSNAALVSGPPQGNIREALAYAVFHTGSGGPAVRLDRFTLTDPLNPRASYPDVTRDTIATIDLLALAPGSTDYISVRWCATRRTTI
jgi:hypothetical protein